MTIHDVPPSAQTTDTAPARSDSVATAARRAVIYIVLPSDPDKAQAAVGALKALCRSRGYMAVGTYRETDLKKRPILRRLFGRARANGFDVVCVPRLDELAASRQRVLRIALDLKALGVDVDHPAGGQFNAEDEALRFLAADVERHRKRVKRAMEAKRRRGECIGEIRFGWRLADDGVHLEQDAEEQTIVSEVLRLSAEGWSQRAIAADLWGRSLGSRNGTALSHTQVGRILAAARVPVPR